MKTYLFLVLKYWRRHKKNAFALLFAGVMLVVISTVFFMFRREVFHRSWVDQYEVVGNYQLLIANSNDEIVQEILGDRDDLTRGTIYVLGRAEETREIVYGTIEDEHDLFYIPMESGRMPVAEDEIAADRGALDKLYWTGKCGDTITLDGKTYTVTGIIKEKYGQERYASPLVESITPEGEKDDANFPIPVIFLGKSDKEPLYRIDFFYGLFDVNKTESEHESEIISYGDKCYEAVHGDLDNYWWNVLFFGKAEDNEGFVWMNYNSVGDEEDANFIVVFRIGALISTLSVFSVLRAVFQSRRGNIEVLKKIGMTRGGLFKLYGTECVFLIALQVILGEVLSIIAYSGIFLYRTSVLGVESISAFTTDIAVTSRSADPFLFSAVISAAIVILAYVVNALTSKVRYKTPKKEKKPRSLFCCIGRAFRGGSVTVVQTACLVLICLSVALGYLYLTDNGKYMQFYGNAYFPVDYDVNGFDMEEYEIEEYYSCVNSLQINGVGDLEAGNEFSMLETSFTEGIDDKVMDSLPECARAAGYLTHIFMICEEEKEGGSRRIDVFDDETVRSFMAEYSSDECKEFFENGGIGTKKLYRAETKLTDSRVIGSLSQYLVDGSINTDKLNSGEEVLIVSGSSVSPIKAGETIKLGGAVSAEGGLGISEVVTADVKVGGVIKLPFNYDELSLYIVRDSEIGYNLLTTASGAQAMGLQGAAYTEIYSSGEINGGLIPSSAKMELTSRDSIETERILRKAEQFIDALLMMSVMSLLGFSAYFNGIGMKIRQKKYQVSVLRAVGTPVSVIRKRFILSGLKLPMIASAITYAIIKPLQISANLFAEKMNEIINEVDYVIYDDLVMESFKNNYNNWWQPNLEIPILIICGVFCLITVILTLAALRKFKSNIAGDLNEGRTRQ